MLCSQNDSTYMFGSSVFVNIEIDLQTLSEFVGPCCDFTASLLEDGNEEVDEQDIGHDEIDRHDCRGDPLAGHALIEAVNTTGGCERQQRERESELSTKSAVK